MNGRMIGTQNCLVAGAGNIHSRATVTAAEVCDSLQPSPAAGLQVPGARPVHSDGR